MRKKLNSIISIISYIILMTSLSTAYAIEANTSGGKTSSEALLTAQPATFSVTVPTALPVNVDASGAITVATDAKISNNSAGPVKVVACQMNTLNNWAITSEPSKAKVGAKEFNFTLNDKAFDTDGAYDTSTWDTIGANNNLPLVYTSEVAPQKNAITETMANILFTVDWDNSPSIIPKSLTVNTPPNKTEYEEGDTFNTEGLTFTLTMEDNSTKTLTANDVIITGGDSITSGTPITATYNGLSCNIPISLPNSYAIGIPEGASTTLTPGKTLQLTSAASYYRSIGRWTSSNEAVATVDSNGLVTAIGMGNATIAYTNGNTNGSINVEVIKYEIDKTKMATSLKALTGNITFRDSTEIPVTYDSAADVSTNGDGSVMAYIIGQDAIVQADGGVLAPVDSSYMLSEYNASSMDLSCLDTSETTDTSYMFGNSTPLTALNLTEFNVSKVKNMQAMFVGCSSLTTLDLTSFDTFNCVDMGGMFGRCSSLTALDLSSFDTSNVTNMRSMFNSCSALAALDISNFDTSSATYMRSMFRECSALTSLDLSSFDISNVPNNASRLRSVFHGCSALATVYARTQVDADKLIVPTSSNIIVKS